MELKGKVAVVTGGARGIGKAIAMELASKGADIAILDMMSSDTPKELEALGVRAIEVMCNVSDAQKAEEAIKEVVEKLGSVDILINNAGITRDNLMLRMKQEEWDAVISINLTGVYNMCKAVFRPMMKAKAGKIVNIASVVGQMGNPGQANYAAAKAGVIGLTKTIAREFAKKNIQANAVAPGFIDTDMTKKLPQEVVDYFISNIPTGTFGTPEDVAKAVSFLSSADSNYITGQVINVDGGLVMS
jgi:3-oxoacyl-[acyl-carrier protein] reductase